MDVRCWDWNCCACLCCGRKQRPYESHIENKSRKSVAIRMLVSRKEHIQSFFFIAWKANPTYIELLVLCVVDDSQSRHSYYLLRVLNQELLAIS